MVLLGYGYLYSRADQCSGLCGMELEEKEKVSCTVIIPTYNEAENIPELVRRLRAVILDIQILVVDDNSPDGTAKVARELGCSVIVRTDKRGLASAVIDGFRSVDSDNIVVIDADLQHPPELVPELLEALKTYDIAVASRYCKGGSIQGWSLTRGFVSWAANLLALPLAPKVKDRGGGFFALRKSVLPPLHKLKGTGFKILLEVLIKAEKYKVTEVPEKFVPRTKGTSKYNAKQVKEYLKQLSSLYYYKYRRFLKFCLVGFLGAILNLGLLALLTEVAGLHYLVAWVITIETVLITNFVLNDLWTFKDRRERGCSTLVRARRYFITCIGGVIIQFGILALLTEVAGVYYIVSATIGIIVGFFWNWGGSVLWAWRVKAPNIK